MLVAELSDLIRRELNDPRLSLVTITGAEVTRDLRHAKVYVSSLDNNTDQHGAVAALQKAAGFLRGEFTRRAGIRVAPEIEFRHDEAIGRGARILELLHSVKDDLKPDDENPPTSS
jgi:ribosome-binding factor A